MDEPANPTPPVFEPPPQFNPGDPSEPSTLVKVFMGPNGLRAGWRLLIYAGLIAAIAAGGGAIASLISHQPRVARNVSFTASGLMTGEGISFFIFLMASWIMAKIEGRTIADYGLPPRKIFGGQFWQGAAIGFASITVLLLALRVAHVFYFGPIALHGADVLIFGLPWAAAFLFVAFFEEYLFRGYALFTLATGLGFWPAPAFLFGSAVLLAGLHMAHVFYFGPALLHSTVFWILVFLCAAGFVLIAIFEDRSTPGDAPSSLKSRAGFWPAAIFLSAVFGAVHHGNSGENWIGAFSAGAIGLVFCLMLRRTGDLWLPVGFHAAWDWGETYFYGVPDSGYVSPQHLFTASFHGPQWLTGGSVGPEGSWLCLALIVILWVIFAAWQREAKFPNPASIPDPRRLG